MARPAVEHDQIQPEPSFEALRRYAEAGVPWFMRVELRRRVPAMVLFALMDGEYQPIVAAAAGTPFRMIEPFEFTIDPASLLDD